uniref:Uncharacterized protein n=1 Tax=Neogobius melanostomus TaxID=47308 RepID=A0A8C6UCA1_9GOBI
MSFSLFSLCNLTNITLSINMTCDQSHHKCQFSAWNEKHVNACTLLRRFWGGAKCFLLPKGAPLKIIENHCARLPGVTKLHCVKLLNMRPYWYTGSVTRGEAVGYLLPLQDRFSGITSHLKLQMCDRSDPMPFI